MSTKSKYNNCETGFQSRQITRTIDKKNETSAAALSPSLLLLLLSLLSPLPLLSLLLPVSLPLPLLLLSFTGLERGGERQRD